MKCLRVKIVCIGIFLLISAGCAGKIKGVNYLQVQNARMDSAKSRVSLSYLRDAGANTVAFIPFLVQDRPDSIDVRLTDRVTDNQLRVGIRDAKALGFQVMIKPHVLVKNSWAGMIRMADDSNWEQWFNSYSLAIEHYAKIASEEKADIFVIGTEINQAADQPFWKPLITHIRKHFSGKLAYVAQNAEGIKQFSHWDLLDIIALTLYPSLGDLPERNAMSQHIHKIVNELKTISLQYNKPFLIAEIGISSRKNAQIEPWEWLEEDIKSDPPDENLQAEVLDVWLDELDGKWNKGVMLWFWSSDPSAGGSQDKGFTIQNKRAEKVVGRYWKGKKQLQK